MGQAARAAWVAGLGLIALTLAAVLVWAAGLRAETLPGPAATATASVVPSCETATPAPTITATAAVTSSPTPSATSSAAATTSPAASPSSSPTATATPTCPPAPTLTPTTVSTSTPTPSPIGTATPSPTSAPAATSTPAVTATSTPVPLPSPTATLTPTVTLTPTATPAPSPTIPPAPGAIVTLAGTGEAGARGDGGPAAAAQLNAPSGVAFGPDGSLYIADTENHRIRRVSPGGLISTIAGTGAPGFSGDGGPATGAQLTSPGSVALGADGSLFVADTGNQRIRRITPGGVISTVAGTAAAGYGGDGGPAAGAQLAYPAGVATGPDGSLYIADTGNHRVRRVNPFGMITTVAGSGVPGFSGDRDAATAARLFGPRQVALGPDGALYIADTDNHRVRMVAADGTISTVAGSGAFGYSGDGSSATSARLAYPASVSVAPDGTLYIADFSNQRIRAVSALGIITTVAGTGAAGYGGDGGPATSALLAGPRGVALGTDGSLYIADTGNHRVRAIVVAGSIVAKLIPSPTPTPTLTPTASPTLTPSPSPTPTLTPTLTPTSTPAVVAATQAQTAPTATPRVQVLASGAPQQVPGAARTPAACTPQAVRQPVTPAGEPVTVLLPSCRPASITVSPSLLAGLPPGSRLVVGYNPAPVPQNEAAAGSLGGGNVRPLDKPVDLHVRLEDVRTGQALPPPPALANASVTVHLPLDPLPSQGDGQFAWLMEVRDGQEFLGYMRLPASFDPTSGALFYSISLASLQGTLFLPALIVPAYVANFDPNVHIWSGPTSVAIDFGVAAPQFTIMEVVGPQVGTRIFVFNSASGNYGWIDAAGVGPV